MMDDTTCDRRTVLRTAGTALAAAAVGTGTASAVCAYTKTDTEMLLPGDKQPCGTSDYVTWVPADTYGNIVGECNGAFLFDAGQYYGWVSSDALAYC